MEGRLLAHYKILRKLGSGGMGEVYEALDQRLGRTVALKILGPRAGTDPTSRARFEREAKTAAALNHPQIATLFDVGEFEGTIYFAMELVRGETLATRLQRGPLPPAEAVGIAGAIAEALAEAHRHGIVHRDIKPSNVMLGERGEVKVVDFGVARRISGADTLSTKPHEEAPPLTEPGVILGTMNYMSPEQARGESVDSRSDFFSLGVVLYESLTGHRPFVGPTSADVLSSILRDPIPAMTDGHGDPLPRRLERALRRLLAKRPQQRGASAQEIVEELAAISIELATPAPRAQSEEAPDFAATLFRAADTLLVGDFENSTGDPQWDDVPAFAVAHALAQSTYVRILPRLRVADTLRRSGRDPLTRVGVELGEEICRRESAPGQIAGKIEKRGVALHLDLVVLHRGAREALVQLGADFNRPEEILEVIDGLAARLRQHLGEPPNWIPASCAPLARVASSNLEALAALAAADRAAAAGNLADAEASLSLVLLADPRCGQALAQLGRIEYALGDHEAARRSLRGALVERDRLTLRERLMVSGHLAILEDDFAEADRAYNEYLRMYPDDAQAYLGLGIAHLARQDLSAASAAFETSIEHWPRATAPRLNLAEVALASNRFAECVEHANRALDLHPGAGDAILLAALAELGAGNPERALARLAEIGQGVPAARAAIATYQAVVELARGGLDAALAILTQARRSVVKLSSRRPFAVHLWLSAGIQRESGNAALLASALDQILTEVDDPEILAYAAKLAVRNGLPAAARALSERLSAPRDGGKDIRRQHAEKLAAAEIQLACGETGGAITFAEEVAKDWPTLESAETLGWVYLTAGRLAEAAVEYEKVIAAHGRALVGDCFPHFAVPAPLLWVRAHFVLGMIYESLGRREEARQMYEHPFKLWIAAKPQAPLLADSRLALATLA